MKVLVIVGPTASGKSDVALHVARLLGGEIVSADSRQVFRYLDIGTAKPAKEQRAEIRHHFIDERDPAEDFNAGEFGIRAREVIEKIISRKKTPIVVGGSGLYVRSLVDGLFEGPGADKKFRERMEAFVEKGKLNELLEELREVDPSAAATIDPTKPRRIIRALEVYHLTGKPLSLHHAEMKVDIRFTHVQFGLQWDRAQLYRRIESRCEDMIKQGLLREVEGLEQQGFTAETNALKTVGYAEAFRYRGGEISFEEMKCLFKQNSRRYAKRQLTWFRADPRIHWLAMTEGKPASEVASEIAKSFLN